jgi:response regulator RpfG family c-di-GMP phosphodiesterase
VPEAARAHVPIHTPIGEVDADARAVIDRAMDTARERLDMTISWVAEFTEERKHFRAVGGDRDEWDLHDGDSWPISESYCLRMVEGVLPNAIPDTADEPRVARLDVTQEKRIGSYIGVPLVLPDGKLCGAFCCADHEARPLDDRDVRFLQVLARLVADEIALQAMARARAQLLAQQAAGAALASALGARDAYTGEHAHAVVRLAGAVAARLGLDEAQRASVELVALLHDVGKVAVPDAVLRKPGPLSEPEWELMRAHPSAGAEIVARVAALAGLAEAVGAEHERWDGHGYPRGLAGEAIPVESRIVLVCDAFHAMTSDRPYRAALTPEAARDELRRCSGTTFWPAAVDALLDELG